MEFNSNYRNLNEKGLSFFNLSIVAYFVGIYFVNACQIDHVIVGVFAELLTIPFLLAQLAFMLLGVFFLMKKGTKTLLFAPSLSLLVASQLYTVLTLL